jgi:hypothetical protein
MNPAVVVASLAVGGLLVVYGLAEGVLDFREHQMRLSAVRQAVTGKRPPAKRKRAPSPGADIGEEQAGPVPSAQDLAKVAEAIKGLPRCVQVFFVAALFFSFALVAASVGTVAG